MASFARRALFQERSTKRFLQQLSASQAASSLITVDLSAKDAGEHVAAAFQGPGFFYAQGHGISPDLMDRARILTKAFFDMPAASKEECVALPGDLPIGYRGGQTKISIDPQGRQDTRESFLFSAEKSWYTAEQKIAVGQLPPDFKGSLTEYWNQVQSLSKHMLQLTCGTLNVKTSHFDDTGCFDDSMSLMNLCRYDETASQVDEGILGCGAHCDSGLITVLQLDPEVEGLEIAVDKHVPRDEMVWQPVPPQRGTFVVACGLALESWSNGRFNANMHRVVSSRGRERVSVPFFLQPNSEYIIKPLPSLVPAGGEPLFQPIAFGEFIQSRFSARGRRSIA